VAIIDLEAQRTNEPQLGANGHARAADIARVEGDFRLIKDDLENGFRHGNLSSPRAGQYNQLSSITPPGARP
jgi:hypothetical protein